MTEYIAETLVGLLVIYLGYRIGWKGQISLLHSYHYNHVLDEDKPQFCRTLGIWQIVIGIGCAAMPWLNLLTRSELGYWIGMIAILGGLAVIIRTIIQYNGRLFG